MIATAAHKKSFLTDFAPRFASLNGLSHVPHDRFFDFVNPSRGTRTARQLTAHNG
jgi:hypothetical protein